MMSFDCVNKFTIEPRYSLAQNFNEPYFKFIIGMPLNMALKIISNQSDMFKEVKFNYSHKIPLFHDIIVTFMKEGIKLYFNSDDQTLSKIEIFNFSLINLYYINIKFNDVQECPSKDRIIQVFGPAKVPEYDSKSKCFIMTYSGLTFYLKKCNDTNSEHEYDSTLGIQSNQPMILNNLIIFNPETQSSSNRRLCGPEKLLECFKSNTVLLKQLRVVREKFRTKYIEFDLLNSKGRIVRFGDHVQDVLWQLGSPSKVYYKTEDKMKIHRLKQKEKDRMNSRVENRKSDYFFNYFYLGLDVMFRYEDDTVSKFILHTNFPDDFLFNTYYRCFFLLELEKDKVNSKLSSGGDNEICEPGSKVTIDTFTKWPEIFSLVQNRADPHPVDVTRFQDNCHKSGISSQTYAYGVDDLIFEKIPDNEHISSVSIYDVTEEDL